MAPKITDPTKTLERLFENLYYLERELQQSIDEGRHAEIIKFWRRRVAATKGTITRVTKMITG